MNTMMENSSKNL